MKKRQEIGRGLRLPVDQDGKRVFDESINKLYVMANESYEDFARALQTEYEEDCGVTFGKVPMTAIARITRVVDGEEEPIGKEAAEAIRQALVAQKMLEADGRLQAAFDPKRPDFKIELPAAVCRPCAAVVDLLASYQIERHIRKDTDEKPNRLKKEVTLSPEFEALWNRIKPKTTYRVEFETETLVRARRRRDQEDGEDRAAEDQGDGGARRGSQGRRRRRGGERRRGAGHALQPRRARRAGLPAKRDGADPLHAGAHSQRSPADLASFSSIRNASWIRPRQLLKYELHRLLVDGIKYDRIGGARARKPNGRWCSSRTKSSSTS